MRWNGHSRVKLTREPRRAHQLPDIARIGETPGRIHAPMGGVHYSAWGRTGPRNLDDFSDVIWINPQSGQRQYPF